MTMRDAEEDEETRVLSPRGATPALLQSERPRQAALPPPHIPRPDLRDAGEDETTKLKASAPWLISEGPNAPRELDHEQLTRELKSGKLSRDVFAWRDGMKQWQSIAEIPSLAGLLGRPARQGPPASNPRASAPLVGLGPLAPTDDVLLSSSVSTADFSRIDHSEAQDKTPPAGSVPPRAPPPKPAAGSGPPGGRPLMVTAASSRPESMPRPAPEQLIDAEADAQAEAAAEEAERESPAPRPAAGRPPTPDEPVAKADPHKVMARTPAIIVAGEAAQGALEPKLSHREVTQPARSRLALAQLRAGSQGPNVLLWVLGAGGWAVAGVLAGILMAKGGEPAAQPAQALEPARASARTAARPEPIAPPASPPPEPTARGPQTPEATAEARSETSSSEEPPAAAPAPAAPRPKTTLSSSIATHVPPEAGLAPPTAPASEPVSAPTADDAINSPGF